MIKEQAVALVKKAIKRLSWKYQYDDEDDIFTIKWRPVYAYASIKMSIYIFDKFLTIIVGSETIVKKNISLVAEYLTRLNYRLAPGAMEMDCDDGEVRYYHRLGFAEIASHHDEEEDGMAVFICCMLVKALMTFDATGPGVFAVMIGAKSPKKAAEKAEALMNRLTNNDDDDGDDDDLVREKCASA